MRMTTLSATVSQSLAVTRATIADQEKNKQNNKIDNKLAPSSERARRSGRAGAGVPERACRSGRDRAGDHNT